MVQDIVIPEVGESVREAVLAEWFVKPGERVTKGTVLFVLETDKVTLEVPAEADGIVEILVPAGQTVSVGAVVGRIQTERAAEVLAEEPRIKPFAAVLPPEVAFAAGQDSARPVEPPAEVAGEAAMQQPEKPPMPQEKADRYPSAGRLAAQLGVDLARVKGTGPQGRITRGDVLLFWESQGHATADAPMGLSAVSTGSAPFEGLKMAPSSAPPAPEAPPAPTPSRGADAAPEETRKPMSPIRKRIAERLLYAKHSTAMLTTFNEVDMTRVMDFRRRFKDAFKEKYGVSLGFMSFFVRACVQALQEIPEVNAFIDGDEIVYHAHVHMGIAVGAERGLVVPVIRYADRLSFAEIERAIGDFVGKIRENRLKLSDLEGGTFTISNGGVYGSLLSTPILNPPQSAILGLHKIEDRPVALNGQVVIRPMMYVALSYDHRIIDGREAVTFLRRIKEGIEDPERLLVGI